MKKASDSIKRGLTEAIAHQKGGAKRLKNHTPAEVYVQALRKQEEIRGTRGKLKS